MSAGLHQLKIGDDESDNKTNERGEENMPDNPPLVWEGPSQVSAAIGWIKSAITPRTARKLVGWVELCVTFSAVHFFLGVVRRLAQGPSVTFGRGIGPFAKWPSTLHPSEPGVKS